MISGPSNDAVANDAVAEQQRHKLQNLQDNLKSILRTPLKMPYGDILSKNHLGLGGSKTRLLKRYRKWKVGTGFHGEQGGEYACENIIQLVYRGKTTDRLELLFAVMKNHWVSCCPSTLKARPTCKKSEE
ncbi:uncharacterized protein LOC117114222 [Anneissia japonica]|uniref:uncharacterized protein LOC117114222 n=1 Tax=Anneissia japonica TaxID=1529436 RepID=UPI001425B953|nr:uncharacterized protein LOC117114222 [Anneissia japonica]XP_033113719.1 uncharacterized protein LOC117114222 [Anneissia japonica]